jgi:hypothetical protein
VKLVEFFARHGYGEGIMILTALVTFIYILRYFGKHRAFRIIPYYIGFCLFQSLIVDFYWYVSPSGDRLANALELGSAAVFTIFEFCVFSLLILSFIAGSGRRLAIKLNALVFFIAEILFYLRTFPRISIYTVCLLELLALAPPCAIYFYELFTTTNPKALKDRASFWVVLGIASLAVLSFTLLLTFEYLGRFGDGAYAMSYVFYSILFVLFIRAYKCSPEERVVD